MKINIYSLYYLGGLATCLASAFVSHTVLPIPPALVIFGLSIVLLFMLVGLNNYQILLPKYGLVVFPFILFLTLTQPFTDSALKNYSAPIISAFFFPLAIYFLNYLNRPDLQKVIYYFIITTCCVLTIETLYRYAFPNYLAQEISANRGSNDSFYMYKASSLMYSDSNGTAIHILIILFFTYYWSRITKNTFVICKYLLWFLLLLSFSRAAWIGAIVGYIYFRFLTDKSLKFWISFGTIIFLGTVFIFLLYIYPLIVHDPSFLLRLKVFEQAFSYFKSSPDIIELITGIGVYQSFELFGRYLHSFFLVQIIEMGVLSAALLLLMWKRFIGYTHKRAFIILVPFVLTTLSSTLSFLPVFYVVLGVMCLVENKYIPFEK